VNPDADIHRCGACSHRFSRLDTMRRLEVYDDRYYDEIHRNWFRHPNTALFRWVEARLPRDAAAILDVGCGNGDLLRFLAERRPGTRLVGLDLHEGPALPGIELVAGDVLTTDVGTFDAVVSLAVIEHVPSCSAFATRLAELVRPGGTVVVMTLDAGGALYSAARAGRAVGIRAASDRLYSAHHLHHFTPRSLRVLLEQAGLTVESVHHHNAPLRAMDFPPTGKVARAAMMAGVAGVFGVGRLVRRGYLQTIVGRRTDRA
jgi:2-polyprenyl-3-methyl-5-hydroxy-6-metoxy-1,4-benzoquinol methylase